MIMALTQIMLIASGNPTESMKIAPPCAVMAKRNTRTGMENVINAIVKRILLVICVYIIQIASVFVC